MSREVARGDQAAVRMSRTSASGAGEDGSTLVVTGYLTAGSGLVRLAQIPLMPYRRGVTADQKASLANVVSVSSEIMHGTPCFAATRVPVQTLLDYIEDGDTLDNFLRDFTTVKREQAIQFLELAKAQLIECASS